VRSALGVVRSFCEATERYNNLHIKDLHHGMRCNFAIREFAGGDASIPAKPAKTSLSSNQILTCASAARQRREDYKTFMFYPTQATTIGAWHGRIPREFAACPKRSVG
jgi:hypothetical protein